MLILVLFFFNIFFQNMTTFNTAVKGGMFLKPWIINDRAGCSPSGTSGWTSSWLLPCDVTQRGTCRSGKSVPDGKNALGGKK